MNSEINPNEALKKVEGFLEKVDELLKKSYKEGFDEKSQLNVRLEGFIRAAFIDDDEKLNDYRSRVCIEIFGYEKSEEEKQEDYITDLKRMKNHILTYKDELELNILSSSGKRIEEKSTIPITQHFHGNVENLALGNISTYNTNIYFDALIKAIEESEEIPKEDKKSLIDKIKDVAHDPYVSGIGAAAIFEGIKALSMVVKPF